MLKIHDLITTHFHDTLHNSIDDVAAIQLTTHSLNKLNALLPYSFHTSINIITRDYSQ